jgi:hypothetical protein
MTTPSSRRQGRSLTVHNGNDGGGGSNVSSETLKSNKKNASPARGEGKMQRKRFLVDGCSETFFFIIGSIAFCILFSSVNIAFLNPLVTTQQPILPIVRGTPYECVLSKNSGGWGNNLLTFLYSEYRESRHNNSDTSFTSKPMFPCVCGSFGVVLGKLFRNVEQCPPGTECTSKRCYRTHLKKENKTLDEIRAFNLQELPKFPSLLELNATFADQIFVLAGVSFTLKDLRTSSCAVQVRFGDAFIRDPTDSRHSSQARACKDHDRNGASCFATIAKEVRKLCPNPRVPIYLATDFPEFTRYFCSREQATNSNVAFLSSCHEKDLVSEGKHINDVALPFEAYSLDELEEDVRSVVVALVSDWLALALAQEVYGIGGSTFRESASYEYVVK